MDFEVEFHPVGDATKAGDAISVRYHDGNQYSVIVVDGGTSDSGEALVSHIKQYYGSDAVIAHAVSSHPDSDHASGLREVMKAFPVERLWLHKLWDHTSAMLPYINDKRFTAIGLADRYRKDYPVVAELAQLAQDRSVPISEPFQGAQIGPFKVMSPNLYAYVRLVPQFRKGPESDVDALRRENWLLGASPQQQLGVLGRLLEKAATWIEETWEVELLREGAITAAENETSTVLFGDFREHSILLTSDAGVNALSWSCDYAESLGIDLRQVSLIQVPHHGSRSNVTPTILNRLLGPKAGRNSPARITAIVSCPKDDEKHPRKMVMNAFRRRGAPVYKTQGQALRHSKGNMPARGWGPAAPFDWFDKVEAYD